MGKPSGRRTVPIRVFLSPAEVEAWEAVRASDPLGVSRADWLMEHVGQELENLIDWPGSMQERCRRALDELIRDEDLARLSGFKERGGRPAHVRPRPKREG